MNNKSKKVSIITVVYNSELLIAETIRSVVNQTYENIQYIVIDGASSDNTLDIINKYKSDIDIIISEPDKGLYDAMNKGLKLASGDYVWFINSGDHIHTPNTVEQMMSKNTNDADIIFGEVMMVDDQRKQLGTRSETTHQKLPKVLTWKSLKYGMVVCHQAFIPKRAITKPYIYDNLSADIDWVIQCLKQSKSNLHTHQVLADFLIGGVSKKRHKESLWGRYHILKKHLYLHQGTNDPMAALGNRETFCFSP